MGFDSIDRAYAVILLVLLAVTVGIYLGLGLIA